MLGSYAPERFATPRRANLLLAGADNDFATLPRRFADHSVHGER